MVHYDFYVSDYLGTAIPETAFDSLAVQAQGVLNRFKRVYQVVSGDPQAENMALCAMAETLYEARRRGSHVAAAAAGSVSVRYQDGKTGRKALMQELYQEAGRYLDIYRGVGA